MSATASAAYIQLADYNRRCREQAKDLPMQQDAVSYWSGVGFVMDGKKYVAPLDEVSELLSVPAYTRIPGARSWMKGVANVRGRLLPLMDLTAFFNFDSAHGRVSRRILVVERGEIYIGMIVDEVFGLQHFSPDEFSAESEGVDPGVARFVQGCYQQGDRRWALFRPLNMLEDQEFFNVAA